MSPIDLNRIWDLLTYHPDKPLLFSSGLFLFLFTIFIYGYFMVHRYHRIKTLYVILFSLFFYYKSSGIYFVLLIFSTVLDFLLAKAIYKSERKHTKITWLIFSLSINLGILCYFKYTNFFAQLIGNLSGENFSPLSIFLPVGISFFTFQSLSYTIDVYRGNIKPLENIFDYAFFVTFFPQLVAGPIVRAADFIPQMFKNVLVTNDMIGRAVFLITSGLIKKVVIADYISVNFVDRVFDQPTLYSGLENLLGIYGYALQIYCDFSGYSDMAIGLALLMGFQFKINFDSPYQSRSVTEFWRRWHISLSTWLRDYLYISLGGNRKGKIRTYINLMITMLLGGLWHGAGLRFILWGGLHGAALGVNKYYNEHISLSRYPQWLKSMLTNRFLGMFLTFHFVCLCWIFFRANDVQIAFSMLHQIFGFFRGSLLFEVLIGYKLVFILMALGYIVHFLPRTVENWGEDFIVRLPFLAKVAFVTLVVLLIIQFRSAEIQPFIYFQF